MIGIRIMSRVSPNSRDRRNMVLRGAYRTTHCSSNYSMPFGKSISVAWRRIYIKFRGIGHTSPVPVSKTRATRSDRRPVLPLR